VVASLEKFANPVIRPPLIPIVLPSLAPDATTGRGTVARTENITSPIIPPIRRRLDAGETNLGTTPGRTAEPGTAVSVSVIDTETGTESGPGITQETVT
jgi:hypothetical protein